MKTAKRIVSLWLPRLSTDRLARRSAQATTNGRNPHDWQARAAATLVFTGGGPRIAAPNPHARDAGIRTGSRLADARALVPDLLTAEADPPADRKLLEAIAGWCERYTPWVAVDPLGDALAAPGSAGPSTGSGGDAGLLLDVSGCSHLFGRDDDGERKLLADLIARLGRHGFACRAAMADTAGAAWALARYAERQQDLWSSQAGHRALLANLPVEGLRLDSAALEVLHRLGLRRIGDLYALPRGPLTRRFGTAPNLRLDQALGAVDEPIEPRRPPPAWRTRLMFAEPIGRPEDIAAACERLLAALCDQLERAGLGARRLELGLFRVDGTVERTTIGTSRASRDPRHLGKLFQERLGELDPGFGVELMMLSAGVAERLMASQVTLPSPPAQRGEREGPAPSAAREGEVGASAGRDVRTKEGNVAAIAAAGHGSAALIHISTGGNTRLSHPRADARVPPLLPSKTMGGEGIKDDAATAALLDRLTQRLGSGRVLALRPRASHLPERAVAALPATRGNARPGSFAAQAALKVARPLRLLAEPEPIDVTAPVPDDPPMMFRWRRMTHRVLRADGPERLVEEWWRGEQSAGSVHAVPRPRDYYRIEDETGQRFWVYRDGPFNLGDTGRTARWYLHGFCA